MVSRRVSGLVSVLAASCATCRMAVEWEAFERTGAHWPEYLTPKQFEDALCSVVDEAFGCQAGGCNSMSP